jgi:hypothetical protein
VPNVHRYRPKNFRPNPEDEYAPAQAAIGDAGTNVNRVLRAFLRWVAAEPTKALQVLAPYLAEVDKDSDPADVGTRGGRPKRGDAS